MDGINKNNRLSPSGVKENVRKTATPVHNILFVSYDGLTDPLGQSQILPYLIGLTQYGYQFTILSCEKPERLQQRRKQIEEIIKPYPIQWEPLLYHKKPPVLSSVYDYRQLLQTAIKLHKQRRFSLVHTRPGIPTLVALTLKKRYGIKFLNDVRGFWADERVDGNMWNLKNPLYKSIYTFFKNKETECLRLNDHTTCLTHSAKREMATWSILPDADRIEVIPCSVDVDLFDPARISEAQKQQVKTSLGIQPNEFVLSYLGTVGTWYMMDEMFQFFQLLLEKKPATKFLIITSAVDHPKVKTYLHRYGVDEQKVILKELDRRDVPLHLSVSDYSIFFIKPCFSKLSSSPTKHGEIMAMGIPVITNTGVGDVKEIVENTKSGFLVREFSSEAYASIIEKMFTQKFDAAAIRQAAVDYYSLTKAVQSYKRVYEEVLQ